MWTGRRRVVLWYSLDGATGWVDIMGCHKRRCCVIDSQSSPIPTRRNCQTEYMWLNKVDNCNVFQMHTNMFFYLTDQSFKVYLRVTLSSIQLLFYRSVRIVTYTVQQSYALKKASYNLHYVNAVLPVVSSFTYKCSISFVESRTVAEHTQNIANNCLPSGTNT